MYLVQSYLIGNRTLMILLSRNIISKQACEKLLSEKAGLNDDSTLVLYGDFNNWFAAFAFWVFKYYGYKDIKIMNGEERNGLKKTDKLKKTAQHFQAETLKPKTLMKI